MHVRGAGSIRVGLIGIDARSDNLISAMLNVSCGYNELTDVIFKNATLHIVPLFSTSKHNAYFKVVKKFLLIALI